MRHESLPPTCDQQIKQPENELSTFGEIKRMVVFTAGLAETVLGYACKKIKRDGVIFFMIGLGDDYRDLKKWTKREL